MFHKSLFLRTIFIICRKWDQLNQTNLHHIHQVLHWQDQFGLVTTLYSPGQQAHPRSLTSRIALHNHPSGRLLHLMASHRPRPICFTRPMCRHKLPRHPCHHVTVTCPRRSCRLARPCCRPRTACTDIITALRGRLPTPLPMSFVHTHICPVSPAACSQILPTPFTSIGFRHPASICMPAHP